jgi:hypothetical protein
MQRMADQIGRHKVWKRKKVSAERGTRANPAERSPQSPENQRRREAQDRSHENVWIPA